MKRILIMIALLSMFTGCKKENSSGETPTSKIYRRSYTMIFAETGSMKLDGHNYNSYDPPVLLCRIRLDMSSACKWDDTGEKQEIYDSFCEKYGDMTYNREGRVAVSEEPSSQMYSFVSLDIVSDADYDEAHLAGSSLADIFIFDAYSSKPYIESGYEKYKFVDALGDTVAYEFYPIRKNAAELTPDDFILLLGGGDKIQVWLHFESLPTLSKEHTFTVTFTDERGETFSDSIEMTFE